MSDRPAHVLEFFQRDPAAPLVSGPPNRVELVAATALNAVEILTPEQALALQGRILTTVAAVTGVALKELGDKGAVSRWCAGKEPAPFYRLLRRSDVRRALTVELWGTVPGTELVLTARTPR